MATAQKPSSAVATTDRRGIVKLLESPNAIATIEPMLRGVDYKRVIGECYLAAGENPQILECTPASIVRAVAKAVGWGLAIGETVHLVPFNVKVKVEGQPDRWEKRLQAIQDYKGKVELIIGAGGARAIDAQVVHEHDVFEYEAGTEPRIRHVPQRDATKRGKMVGAYAIAHHGYRQPPHVLFMPIADIDADRKKYSKQWKDLKDTPGWYAKKTVVHRVAKLLPKNPRLAKVLSILAEDEIPEEPENGEQLPAGDRVATVEAPGVTRGTDGVAELDDRWIEAHDRDAAGEEG